MKQPKNYVAREFVEAVVVAIEEEGTGFIRTLPEWTSTPSLELSHPRSDNIFKSRAFVPSATIRVIGFSTPGAKAQGIGQHFKYT
jgi:hypothetical protein